MLWSMCGRYATTMRADDLSAEFGAFADVLDEPLRPDYNVAPTARVPVIRRSRTAASLVRDPGEGGAASARTGGGVAPVAPDADGVGRDGSVRVVDAVRWGLVPSWASTPAIGSRLINARAESLTDKPAFRAAFARRRCLVPADGWYEWAPRPDGPGRRPFYLTPDAGGLLAFAGLWEVWGRGDDRLLTCTIVTTAAVGPLAAVHDRMPLVLTGPDRAAWLDGDADAATALLAKPPAAEVVAGIELRPVGPAVGNVANTGPRLRDRVAPDAPVPVAVPDTLF